MIWWADVSERLSTCIIGAIIISLLDFEAPFFPAGYSFVYLVFISEVKYVFWSGISSETKEEPLC